MKRYLIDTTVLVDHFRNVPQATSFLLHKQNLGLAYVSLAELFQGARDKHELAQIETLVSTMRIYWGTEAVNKQAIDLLEQYHLSHGAHFLDMLMASLALKENLILVTQNLKHFRFIPNLAVELPPYAH